MKKLSVIALIVFLAICLNLSFSQEITPPKQLYFGFSFGFSFFSPTGVNNNIQNYLDSRGISITSGTSDIIMNITLKANITYMINESFGLTGMWDMAFAPKVIVVENGASESFSFNRFSPGVLGELYLGSKEYRKFMIGIGAFYNLMSFRNYSASGLSYRLEAGEMIKFSNHRIRLLAVLNIMPPVNSTMTSSPNELNYTDFGFCVGFDF